VFEEYIRDVHAAIGELETAIHALDTCRDWGGGKLSAAGRRRAAATPRSSTFQELKRPVVSAG